MSTKLRRIAAGAVGLGAIALLANGCASQSVNAADKTVRTSIGGKLSGVEGPGFHLHMFGSGNTYSCGNAQTVMSKNPTEGDKQGNDAVQAASKEGASIEFDVTVSYHLVCTDSSLRYLYLQHIRSASDILERIVRPAVRSALRDKVAKYTALEATTSARGQIEAGLRAGLVSAFEQKPGNNSITVDAIAIRQTYLPPNIQAQVDNAIAEQAKANQILIARKSAVTQAETNRLVAEQTAEQQKIKAEGDSAQARINADTAAYTAKVTAEQAAANVVTAANAEANANKAVAASLTPDLIDLKKAIAQSEALGKAGTVIVGGGSSGSSAGTSSVVIDARAK